MNSPSQPASTATAGDRFARLKKMIGSAGLDRLQQAKVVVVGLGAVGSYAVEGMARAGIGWLRLVDFDVLRLSNINRQLYALESTLGQAKVEVARQRVLDINPACAVESLSCFAHHETLDQVFDGGPDVVVDAIDSLAPKVELIADARRRGLTIISSMGAARRWDPARIVVGQIDQAQGCPLARAVRKRLRRRGVPVDFLCVYSSEPVPEEDETEEMETPAEPEYFTRGRTRETLGSLPTITGIFGLTLAHVTIQVLLKNCPGKKVHFPD